MSGPEDAVDGQELVAHPSNAGQAETWSGKEGELWAAEARRFDETLEGHHGPFLAAADLGDRDRVLDVGCGNGQSTRDAARVAADGAATGIDLSAQMIAVARRLALEERLDNVEFHLADAQSHPFEPGAFDAVISRMGSMFFGDPASAFANLHRALRSGGRLTLLTWQDMADNEWLTAIRDAMAVGRTLPTPPPEMPNPFSLADPERVRTILAGAGFEDITFQAVSAPMRIGSDVDNAFDFVVGMFGGMLGGLDETDRATGLSNLRQSIADHLTSDGVAYDSASWIVQAHTP